MLVYFFRVEGFCSGGFLICVMGVEVFEGINSCVFDNGVVLIFELFCLENNFFIFEFERNIIYEVGVKGCFF